MNPFQFAVVLIPVAFRTELSADVVVVVVEAVEVHVAVPAVAVAIVTGIITGTGVVEDVLHCV